MKKKAQKPPEISHLSRGFRIRGAKKRATPKRAPGQPFLTPKDLFAHSISKKWSKSGKIGVQIFASQIKSVIAKTEQHWEERQDEFNEISETFHEAGPSLQKVHDYRKNYIGVTLKLLVICWLGQKTGPRKRSSKIVFQNDHEVGIAFNCRPNVSKPELCCCGQYARSRLERIGSNCFSSNSCI